MAEDLEARGIREVLDDHFALRERGKLDEDLRRNYSEDVVILTPREALRGHDGVREAAGELYEAVGEGNRYEYLAIVTDERVGMLEWSAHGDRMDIRDGVDSYLVEDGKILVQTIRYTVTFSDISMAKSVGT